MADRATLECNHCGDVAVESDEKGLFWEDMADRCVSCGMPGHVSLDDWREYEAPAACSWTVDDDLGVCTRPDCEECREAREEASHG